MSSIVVIGAGLGGLAASARLAKQGHTVTLVEAADRVGGGIEEVTKDGFAWDAGPHATLLPAALRDLFRKSGRPLERELGEELAPLPVIREHRFADETSVRVPGGSRAAQVSAFDELGRGLGRAWTEHIDTYAPVWDVLRKHYVEHPWRPDHPHSDLKRLLSSRETLHKRLRRDLRDDRLALVAGHLVAAEGHELRNAPAWTGVGLYLEQCFGAWTIPGGMSRLADLLATRLATRKVTVLTGTIVRDLEIRGGRVAAVRLDTGTIDADAVVVAIDPRRLPTLAPLVQRTMPALPPVVTHLGLSGDVPDLPAEVTFHSEATVTVRTTGRAPDGHRAWTLHGRGKLAEDMLDVLVRHHVDVRRQVVCRVDRSPRDQVHRWNGSPMGVLWQGRGTIGRRLGPATPITGVYVAGAHGAPGAGVPFVTQSGALVAQLIGPA